MRLIFPIMFSVPILCDGLLRYRHGMNGLGMQSAAYKALVFAIGLLQSRYDDDRYL